MINNINYKIRSIIEKYLQTSNIFDIANYFRNKAFIYNIGDIIFIRSFLDGDVAECKIIDVKGIKYLVQPLNNYLKNQQPFFIKRDAIISNTANKSRYSRPLKENDVDDKILNSLITDINSVDVIKFKTDEEYKNEVCQELCNVINDYLLMEKNKKLIKENNTYIINKYNDLN